MSAAAVLGSLLLGLGIVLAIVNLTTAVRNHYAPRRRSAHLFLAPGLAYFAAALALRRFYRGWQYGLALLALIVASEGLPLLVASLLLARVRRRAERLEGADLEAANLEGRSLRGARLRAANLRRANLERADLRDADLTDADLCNADLRGAFLVGATLDGARFDGADLRETEIDRVLGFEKARYSHETRWPDEMDRAAIPANTTRSGTSSTGLS